VFPVRPVGRNLAPTVINGLFIKAHQATGGIETVFLTCGKDAAGY